MSLATCCPACGTVFRVVPDQLRISDGWVRCGKCGEVFDANEHLRGTQEAAAQVPPAAAPEENTAPAPSDPELPIAGLLRRPEQLSAVDLEIDIDPDAIIRSPRTEAATAPAPAPGPAAAPPPPPPHSTWPEGYKLDLDSIAPGIPGAPEAAQAHEQLPDPLAQAAAAPNEFMADVPLDEDGFAREREAVLERDGSLGDPSFMRQARRRAFWRRGPVRLALVVLAVLLALLLGAQVAVHQRDRLAASQPALRPVLQQLCRPLGCDVGLPRRIEALVIDSSAFGRLAPDTYRLAFTLRNASAAPVAMPALELTLTDSMDQPLLRRVLMPAELGAQAPALLAARGEWSGALALAVDPSAAGGRVAGYRLLAFYP